MAAAVDPDWGRAFDELWRRLGPETRTALLDLLPEGFSFEGRRVLDFGSGPGRTLREFRSEAERAELWGVDVDPESVATLERELCPPMHALRCGPWPPLPFDAGSFDLAWAISVFTHLTDNSLPWLLELHRLLRPGGLLIATTIGPAHSEFFTGQPWDEDGVGMMVLRHDSPWDQGGPVALISDWWVREHWGRAFEIVRVAPGIHNQTWTLMRKREVTLTVEDLERPGEDPREHAALRHNLRQVQRELEIAHGALERERADHAAALEQLRSHYETSTSWRLTRPLREARRVARDARARRSGA